MSLLPGYPFGKNADGNAGETNQYSLRMSTIASAGPLTQLWAVADVDFGVTTDPAGLGNDEQTIAQTPVHRSVRNYLFFDGHGATKPVAGPANF
jgi:prepilin-type processing-associated H-X9-DG protein